jgi:hypothetical protein
VHKLVQVKQSFLLVCLPYLLMIVDAL